MTSIYFLLRSGEFSAFHRIASDEVWHHYEGATLCIYEITAGGALRRNLLGKDIAAGSRPSLTIEAGSWFASRIEEPDTFALCGCTVAPGFDFADFELAERGALAGVYPEHAEVIGELTRL
jgi:predicted cupin superfamily sugar epimerase